MPAAVGGPARQASTRGPTSAGGRPSCRRPPSPPTKRSRPNRSPPRTRPRSPVGVEDHGVAGSSTTSLTLGACVWRSPIGVVATVGASRATCPAPPGAGWPGRDPPERAGARVGDEVGGGEVEPAPGAVAQGARHQVRDERRAEVVAYRVEDRHMEAVGVEGIVEAVACHRHLRGSPAPRAAGSTAGARRPVSSPGGGGRARWRRYSAPSRSPAPLPARPPARSSAGCRRQARWPGRSPPRRAVPSSRGAQTRTPDSSCSVCVRSRAKARPATVPSPGTQRRPSQRAPACATRRAACRWSRGRGFGRLTRAG